MTATYTEGLLDNASEFHRWLGIRHPYATVVGHRHNALERLLVGFYEQLVSIEEAHFVIREAGFMGGWLPWVVDWTLEADGRLAVRCIRFVRGTV